MHDLHTERATSWHYDYNTFWSWIRDSYDYSTLWSWIRDSCDYNTFRSWIRKSRPFDLQRELQLQVDYQWITFKQHCIKFKDYVISAENASQYIFCDKSTNFSVKVCVSNSFFLMVLTKWLQMMIYQSMKRKKINVLKAHFNTMLYCCPWQWL